MDRSNQQSINPQDILNFIPDERFAQLAEEYAVDYEVKILTGRLMFTLLVLSILRFDILTQRRVSLEFESKEFQQAVEGLKHKRIKHNSIGYRLRSMDNNYFRQLFNDLFRLLDRTEMRRMEKQFGGSEIHDLVAIDSTLVSYSTRYLTDYIEVKKPLRAHKPGATKNVKYSFGFADRGVMDALIYTGQKYLSENNALYEIIDYYRKHDPLSTNIYLIDRGLNSSDNFNKLKDNHVEFICRVNMNRTYEAVGNSKIPKCHPIIDAEIMKLHENDEVISDQIVHLRKKRSTQFDSTEYRLIKVKTKAPVMSRKGHRDRMDEELWLITDNMNLPALEIVAFYGLRWRIECLFRFLKQKLSLNKFISCTPNGIANMIYIILMTAMLVLLFARLNHLGYTEAKDRLYIQLEDCRCSITNYLSCRMIDDSVATLGIT